MKSERKNDGAPAESKWGEPAGASPAQVAFPANVCGTLLPLWSEVPEAIQEDFHRRRGLPALVETAFYQGGRLPAFKAGVDRSKALTQLHACLGSYEPKHEHKIAGVAYLLSLWCEDVP